MWRKWCEGDEDVGIRKTLVEMKVSGKKQRGNYLTDRATRHHQKFNKIIKENQSFRTFFFIKT